MKFWLSEPFQADPAVAPGQNSKLVMYDWLQLLATATKIAAQPTTPRRATMRRRRDITTHVAASDCFSQQLGAVSSTASLRAAARREPSGRCASAPGAPGRSGSGTTASCGS